LAIADVTGGRRVRTAARHASALVDPLSPAVSLYSWQMRVTCDESGPRAVDCRRNSLAERQIVNASWPTKKAGAANPRRETNDQMIDEFYVRA
jgi:hypothetical protein